MKNKIKKIASIIILLLSLKSVVLHSQSSPNYTVFTGVLSGVGTSASNVNSGNAINFSNTAKILTQPSQLRQRNKSAKLLLRLDLGDNYIKQASNWNFKIIVNLSYQFNTTPASSPVVKTLTITNNAPEMLKYDNVLQYFTTASPTLAVSITSVSITDGTVALAAGLLKNYVDNNLRLSAVLEREYEVDVRFSSGLMSNAAAVYPVSISSRLVTFSWQPNNVDAYTNYEVQILKLHNKSDAYKTNTDQLSTIVDWQNALKVETQSHKPSVKLTIGEGSGIYVWRVRPIGNYFAGGIANSENYGEWSYSLPSASSATLSINSLTSQPTVLPYAFYFKDPDEKINWIYSRVFTEGDDFDKTSPTGVKTSEGMNYADGLQRVRQNQKYNSSENTKIVSQTINDYNGRPALSTIPVPVNGGLTGYTYSFVTNSSGVLYTAQSFDEDTNLNNPATVKDNGTSAFAYYSNNATTLPDNKNVPNAEGYPFKRTVYTTDGTSRVAEESGVGKAHALGTQANGRGRTTRILYSAPTDDELIRIFGDEAPLAESVVKTITIDQNNVMSITYTSKEGKTIATALTSEYTDNLSAMAQTATNLTVTNTIDQNTNASGKIISSKRIAIPSNSMIVTLSYSNDAMPGPSTGCASGKCNFKMRLYLVDLNTSTTYASDADNTTAGNQDFVVSGVSFSFTSGWRFVKTSSNTNTLAPATITLSASNELLLNRGEYMFIKEIFSGNGENYAESIVAAENEKTKPIIEAITEKMQSISSTDSYTAFTQFMSDLKTKVDNYNANGGVTTASLLTFLQIDAATLPPGWIFPSATDFSLAPISNSSSNPAANNLQISSSCCGNMSVPIPKLPFCVLCDGAPNSQTVTSIVTMTAANAVASPTVMMPYGLNDLKGSSTWTSLSVNDKLNAVNKLVEREFIDALKNKMNENGISHADLWKLAPGFSFERLNFMFSNMLISQYYTGSAIQNTTTGKWHAATPNSAGGYSLATSELSLTASTYSYNYDCKKLYQTWMTVVESINSFEVVGNENIVKEFNDADGKQNSAQDNAEDDDNWEDMSRRKKKKMKKALKTEMTDFSNSNEGTVSKAKQDALSSIMSSFISAIGCQYAAIIDGAPLPAYISSVSAVYPDDYSVNFTSPLPAPSTPAIFLGASAIAGNIAASTYSSAPYLFEVDAAGSASLTTVTCNSTVVKELFYPYILKPEWMFKYFVYNQFENNITTSGAINYISDVDMLLPHQAAIDIDRQYNEPYSYLPTAIKSTIASTGVCNVPPANSFTSGSTPFTFSYYHLNWTAEERQFFYEAIKGAARCPVNKGITANDSYYEVNATNTATFLPECDSKANLVAGAIAELNYRISECYDKKAAIISALRDELVSACYTIVTCKTGTGQVTENEIEMMALNAINTATAQINTIKIKFTAMTSTNNAICATVSSITSTYSDGLCNLPACTQTDCKEIVLYNNNTIGIIDSRKLSVKYFADCDKKILDMLWDADFLPDVPKCRPDCIKPDKVWITPGCTTNQSCQGNSPTYTEKNNCGTTATHEKYSGTYTLQASQ
jgi:hypothetical protein